ncbi:MAG: C40 family peptidase, partial [Actinobacteria bacterium]|nr:C40 family peptidase [Actinomycetota bacterium]
MVASLALPASAATVATVAVQVRATAPAAVAASLAAQAPLAPRSFGNIDFTGVDKPKPKPKPVPVAVVPDRTIVSVSRSTTRAPLTVPAPRSSGVLGIAASLAGIYYIYGGTTTAGFDCSGFTQYVFDKVGISLPRTAEQQRQATT